MASPVCSWVERAGLHHNQHCDPKGSGNSSDKQVEIWCQETLGQTLQSERRQAFAPLKKRYKNGINYLQLSEPCFITPPQPFVTPLRMGKSGGESAGIFEAGGMPLMVRTITSRKPRAADHRVRQTRRRRNISIWM